MRSKEVNHCYGCTQRHMNCHSMCDKYKEWKAEKDRLREEEAKRKILKGDFIEYEKNKSNRLRHYRNTND